MLSICLALPVVFGRRLVHALAECHVAPFPILHLNCNGRINRNAANILVVDLCATEAANRQPRNLPAISALLSGHDELYQVHNLILRQVALQTILERFRNIVSLFLEVLVAGAWQRAMTHLRPPESSDR